MHKNATTTLQAVFNYFAINADNHEAATKMKNVIKEMEQNNESGEKIASQIASSLVDGLQSGNW